MTMKKAGLTTKDGLQGELKKIHATLKALQQDFKKIQKQSRNLSKKASISSDDKKVQALRKKLAGQ